MGMYGASNLSMFSYPVRLGKPLPRLEPSAPSRIRHVDCLFKWFPAAYASSSFQTFVDMFVCTRYQLTLENSINTSRRLSYNSWPHMYRESFNSIKRLVRTKAYQHITNELPDYAILDIDLKSCYTTVLLGLFPIEMHNVREAIEGSGLWNHMETLFINSGRQSLFN
jgi:hypothetical protein